MENLARYVVVGVMGSALLFSAHITEAEDLSGLIARTFIISEDTRLVGNVTCTVQGAPCIAFGAPNITLYLNGFTMTGLASATTGCSGGSVTGEFGISTNNEHGAAIRGPGVVQRFRNSGIFVMGTTGGHIQGVTTTTNCISGIQVGRTGSKIRIESNVAVRNGHTAAGSPRGGITILGNDNKIRWNETSGNGYAEPTDDYGIGIVEGHGNVIEGNTAMGNTNGIALFPGTTGTIVRANIVVGNPPIQISVTLPGSPGVDILNLSGRGMTTFERNLCLTASDATCPDLSPSAVARKPQN
jgi:parallel beta-helix repeat protein